MSAKTKFPRAAALEVVRELKAALEVNCESERFIVAGSLRRRKAGVGDVELVFVPKMIQVPDRGALFGGVLTINAAEAVIDELLGRGVIERRLNKLGRASWGDANKLAVHVASGIPVDLFTATQANWWNYVVCRTGGAESNTAICQAAIDRGWQWNPYGEGFSRPSGLGREVHAVRSEREVFEFVGMDYLEPWERR